jgi:hypothetical protein
MRGASRGVATGITGMIEEDFAEGFFQNERADNLLQRVGRVVQ